SRACLGRGLRRRGELAADESDELVQIELAREARRLAVPPSPGLACDPGHVELVGARAQAHAMLWPAAGRRLADEYRHVGALDRAQVVDDPLRVRLDRADLEEVAPQEVRDDESAAVVHLRPFERPRQELQFRELDALVYALEHALEVRPGLDQLRGEAQ